MTSTIKVNTIQNACGADIIKESSNTITIGASGDTVTLASGASQTGFGRTGTVNWDTTIKTSGFTGVSGNGYFTDTTSSAFTITLPASPSAGDIIAVADYANTWDTNNLTLGRNSSNIEGSASDLVLNQEGASVTVVYADATKGWIVVNSGNSSQGSITPAYVTATGGTVVTSGDFKIHVFTGPGTFCVSCAGNATGSNKAAYLVVAGGGGGAGDHGGGGGAGGYRESSGDCAGNYAANPLSCGVDDLTLSEQGYPISVGAAGTGTSAPPCQSGGDGGNSIFSTITSAGGGGGGRGPGSTPGRDGGSGGGVLSPSPGNAGAGNTPAVTPPQGSPGNYQTNSQAAGGGGGAGGPSSILSDQNGKVGMYSAMLHGTPAASTYGTTGPQPNTRYFSGGGGGGVEGSATAGTGGAGGGGAGSGPTGCTAGNAGTTNTGGGGGGASGPGGSHKGGNGGSGIVMIRYKFQN